jgi:hypothetical protein
MDRGGIQQRGFQPGTGGTGSLGPSVLRFFCPGLGGVDVQLYGQDPYGIVFPKELGLELGPGPGIKEAHSWTWEVGWVGVKRLSELGRIKPRSWVGVHPPVPAQAAAPAPSRQQRQRQQQQQIPLRYRPRSLPLSNLVNSLSLRSQRTKRALVCHLSSSSLTRMI